jgi:hypothetical protein
MRSQAPCPRYRPRKEPAEEVSQPPPPDQSEAELRATIARLSSDLERVVGAASGVLRGIGLASTSWNPGWLRDLRSAVHGAKPTIASPESNNRLRKKLRALRRRYRALEEGVRLLLESMKEQEDGDPDGFVRGADALDHLRNLVEDP